MARNSAEASRVVWRSGHQPHNVKNGHRLAPVANLCSEIKAPSPLDFGRQSHVGVMSGGCGSGADFGDRYDYHRCNQAPNLATKTVTCGCAVSPCFGISMARSDSTTGQRINR
jgi:hypothetical protein